MFDWLGWIAAFSRMTVVRQDPSAFIAKGAAAGEEQGFDPFDQVFDHT